MSDIPSEAFREMLLRVPPEPLLRFRAVCKAWRRIIDDPAFVKIHTNNQLSSPTLLIRGSNGRLLTLCLDSLKYVDGTQTIELSPVAPLSRLGVPKLPKLPVASCNGLILISHFDPDKAWVIWNLLTRDFHELPELNSDLRFLGSGLGYDSATDDYKVVRIDEENRNGKTVYRTLVYSLKLDSWKRIKNCPCKFVEWAPGVFANEALYWRSWDIIIKLDLGSEEYSKLPLPPPPVDVLKSTEHLETYLDVLGGFLVLSYHYSVERLDGWIMKDCKVKKSWTKLFSLEKLHIMGAMWTLRPIAYFKSKAQIVLLQNDKKLLLLDIEKNSVKKITIGGFPDFKLLDNFSNFSSQICPGSLFRLSDNYDVCRTVATKRTKAQRKRANARLKLTATTTDIWYRSDSEYDSDSSLLSDGED